MTAPQRYSGLFPVAPTPFTPEGDVDWQGQRRIIDCMVDQGVDGICILANYSEQFLLSDQERELLIDVCLEQASDRVPVMVTCSHFSTRISAARARYARERGASMIMLMPPYHGAGIKLDESAIFEHFAKVADAAKIPLMIQDAPLSGVNLSVDFLVRTAQTLPLVRYFKIEVPGTASKLRRLIEEGGSAVEGPFDGEEAITLMADLDAGATGVMSSAMIPDLIKPVLENHRSGAREDAAAIYRRILPLINYENRQCGLRAAKTIMMEGRVIKSDHVRHPLEQIHPSTRAGLLELARELNPIALHWGR